MSDLEDDVLMQLIETAKKLDHVKTETSQTVKYYKDRADLLDEVWLKLDALLKEILRHPGLADPLQLELEGLQKSVVAVLMFDEGGVLVDKK
jgi:hypothetical protein